jgi:cytochrome c oxidase cbb3-type subunit 3
MRSNFAGLKPCATAMTSSAVAQGFSPAIQGVSPTVSKSDVAQGFSPAIRGAVALLIVTLAMSACKREKRDFVNLPPSSTAPGVRLSDLHPGGGFPPPPAKTPYELNASALSEGKRLFGAYNCSGCHANGGGGIGPALMDDQWIYGAEADQIFHTIVEGRPNGMPSFGGKIPDYQVWQLAAYVRSLGGLAPKDAATSRSDHMSGTPVESSTVRQQPKRSSLPPSAVQ